MAMLLFQVIIPEGTLYLLQVNAAAFLKNMLHENMTSHNIHVRYLYSSLSHKIKGQR